MSAAQQYIQRLTVASELIAAHPDLPLPCVFGYPHNGAVEVTWQLMNDDATRDDQRAAVQQIVRAIGGKWDKHPWGDRFDFGRDYHGVKLEIYTHRDQVCERVVTGTETVTIPAKAAEPERTEERELVEWRCEPVLAEAAS